MRTHEGNKGGRLLEAYLAYARDLCRDRRNDKDYWAVDALRELITEDAESAWHVVQELVRRAEDDSMLAFIAAGPLEDLLAEQGPLLIDRIGDSARENAPLRRALSGVWGENRIDPAVLERLRVIVRDEPPF